MFSEVKEHITSERTNLQFVESYNHRVNAAEHGYNVAKYHTLATLCTIDPVCPVQLWDICVPQVEATLNVMWTSRINTSKSAYEELNRQKFVWNRTLLAPVGQQALVLLD